ncbi:hypothetical protein OG249_00080 [Streptomyces microflavus]|nr:hypothetical protein [Streptomyces microflavus]MCX4650306.1 hypothetical protein [Streptomyces microflavus]
MAELSVLGKVPADVGVRWDARFGVDQFGETMGDAAVDFGWRVRLRR